jgi:hypothetical protein
MDPFALRAAFRVAILILIVAAVMLPFQPTSSAQFVVTVMALFVGILFTVAVVIAARLSGSQPPNRRPVDRVSSLRSNVRNDEGPARSNKGRDT